MTADTPTSIPKGKTASRQASDLLDELESIKSLLGEDIEQIPVLEEMVEDAPPLPETETTPLAHGALPGQQALFDSHQPESAQKPAPKQPPKAKKNIGENPFLPQHIRKRLGASSAEIAKSLASTDRELEKQSLLQPTHEDSRFISATSTGVIAKPVSKKTAPENSTLNRNIANHNIVNHSIANQNTRDQLTPASSEKSSTPIPDSLKATVANPDDIIDSLVKQYMPIIEDELRRQLKAIAEGKPPQ